MIVEVDLTCDPPSVALKGPEDCGRFHITVRGGDRDRLATILWTSGVGHLLPSGDDAMIDTAAVVRLAAGRVPDGWDEQFAGMVAYARSKGWTDDRGVSIQGHIEWATEPFGP